MKLIFQSTLTALLLVVGLLGFYFAWFFIIDSSPTFTDEQRQIGHFISLITGFFGISLSFYLSKKFNKR